jgi:hypothetical protein
MEIEEMKWKKTQNSNQFLFHMGQYHRSLDPQVELKMGSLILCDPKNKSTVLSQHMHEGSTPRISDREASDSLNDILQTGNSMAYVDQRLNAHYAP